MWYIAQTTIGREEYFKMKAGIRISKSLCQECLFLKTELLKRLGGTWVLQAQPLFPGYLFIKTDLPKELNRYLETASLGHLLKAGGKEFIPLRSEEEQLIAVLTRNGSDSVIRISAVDLSESGKIRSIDGILNQFEKNIIKMNLRKRFAIVKIQVLGNEKTLLFGIYLSKDRNEWNNMKIKNENNNLKNENKFETCVLCRKITNIPIGQEIRQRSFYIEGAGQLCSDCYKELYRRG